VISQVEEKKAREIVAYSRRKMELIEKESKRYPSKRYLWRLGSSLCLLYL